MILLASILSEDEDLLAIFYCLAHKRQQKRQMDWRYGIKGNHTTHTKLYGLVCVVSIFDMLKVTQAALMGLHGEQFSCPQARSCLRKPQANL